MAVTPQHDPGLTSAACFSDDDRCLYQERLDLLWRPLVAASCYWFIFKKVSSFPSELLFREDDRVFLHLAEAAFAGGVILNVVSLLADRHRDACSLPRMRGWMLEHCRDECRERLEQHLAARYPVEADQALCERAKAIRDRVLAHIDPRGLPSSMDPLTQDELQTLVDAAGARYAALCLDSGRALLVAPYWIAEQAPSGRPTDVDRFLTAIAGTSDVLRIPEIYGPEEFAAHLYDELAAHGDIYNEWRRRVGLWEVDWAHRRLRPPL